MQQINVTVTSKGTALGDVPVAQYDSVQEAVELLGEEVTLSIINKSIEKNMINNFRTSKTRKPSKQTALRELMRLAESSPEIKAQLDAILAQNTEASA